MDIQCVSSIIPFKIFGLIWSQISSKITHSWLLVVPICDFPLTCSAVEAEGSKSSSPHHFINSPVELKKKLSVNKMV